MFEMSLTEEMNFKVMKLVDANNYLPWKFQVDMIRRSVPSVEVLEQEMPMADKVEEHKRWKKADAAVQRIIVTSVAEKILLMLVSCKTSGEMFERLEALYGRKPEVSLHVLEKQFFAATFDSKNGIVHHVTKLENLGRKISALGEPISDRMIINKIINTLPDEYL